jgi:hypothetical protein
VKASRTTVVPLVIVGVLLTSAARCGNPQTVGDAARALESGKYSEGQLAKALRSANGGENALADDAAKGLDSSDAVDQIVDAAPDVADLACQAWENRPEDSTDGQLPSLSARVQADSLLKQMNADVKNEDATTATITFACKVKDLLP